MSLTILLRSSWQSVNIGDVAHSPGALRAFRRWAPGAQLILWPVHTGVRERAMFADAFPEVRVVEGELLPDGSATTPELTAAVEAADVLVHGSAPGIIRGDDLLNWSLGTGKPFGLFGVSVDPLSPAYAGTLAELEVMLRELEGPVLDQGSLSVLNAASFIYCRDSLTEVLLRSMDLECPIVEFGPDATFAFDVLDEESAAETRSQYGLVPGQYMCAVPRLRRTPYHQIRGTRASADDRLRDAYNALWMDQDLGVLAAAITTYVRRTGNPVLIAPEMVYAMELAQTHLVERLPADVRGLTHVLPRFWSASEAMTVYRDAQVVVSMECHSPLMAISQGTPAIYLRQPSDTIKGRMYADVGAGHRTIEIDDGPAPLIAELSRIIDSPTPARRETETTRLRAHRRLEAMVKSVVALTRPRTETAAVAAK
ncbi:polysaccharide pyruvyl transferase family protein [Tessaracoccus terricola]